MNRHVARSFPRPILPSNDRYANIELQSQKPQPISQKTSRNTHSRYLARKSATKDEKYLIHLREVENFTWKEIAARLPAWTKTAARQRYHKNFAMEELDLLFHIGRDCKGSRQELRIANTNENLETAKEMHSNFLEKCEIFFMNQDITSSHNHLVFKLWSNIKELLTILHELHHDDLFVDFYTLAQRSLSLLMEECSNKKLQKTWSLYSGILRTYNACRFSIPGNTQLHWNSATYQYCKKLVNEEPTNREWYQYLSACCVDTVESVFWHAKSSFVAVPGHFPIMQLIFSAQTEQNSDFENSFLECYKAVHTAPKDMSQEINKFLSLVVAETMTETHVSSTLGTHLSIINIAILCASESQYIPGASDIFNATATIFWGNVATLDSLLFTHNTLIFLLYLAKYPQGMSLVGVNFPWGMLINYLNILCPRHSVRNLHIPDEQEQYPLAEDFVLMGMTWTKDYFPADWFCREEGEDCLAGGLSTRERQILRIHGISWQLSQLGFITHDNGLFYESSSLCEHRG